MGNVRKGRVAGLAAAITLVGTGLVAPATATTAGASNTITTIATGLNNPRGVAWTNGRLYVAEAGLGAGSDATGVQLGIGMTGSITEVDGPGSSHPTQWRIAKHLWSAAADEGNGPEALGPDGIAADNRKVDAVIGAGGVPGTQLGDLVSIAGGHATTIAKVGDFSLSWTGEHKNEPWAPEGQFPDADPYGVLFSNGHTYVVDAAANTLDEVFGDGSVHVAAYFPNAPFSDAVPTCATTGPDGALYVGTLALADFFAGGPGRSIVYRVDPTKIQYGNLNRVLSVATPWATGFSTITGCTFDKHGNFYAAEMFAGDVQVAPFAHPTQRWFLGQGSLVLPNGIAADNSGNLYVSVMSDSAQAGQGAVVRIRLS